MSTRVDCEDAPERDAGIAQAVAAVHAHDLVVLPTDTVYAVGCDAFSALAVRRLLEVRGTATAPPVLVPRLGTLDGVATSIPHRARELAEALWPGPLTLVLHAQPTLDWSLGATVAVRMPAHPVALELLELTGPLAATGAHRAGSPAARSCAEAEGELGEAVAVYLDAGPATTEVSTVVSATGDRLRVLREGALDLDDLRMIVPDLVPEEEVRP